MRLFVFISIFHFLFSCTQVTASGSACPDKAIWQYPEYKSAIQTSDGSVYAISDRGEVVEMKLNKLGMVDTSSISRIDGINAANSFVSTSKNFFSRAFVVEKSDAKSTLISFDENGALKVIAYKWDIAAYSVLNNDIFIATKNGNLWRRNIETLEMKKIINIPILAETKQLLFVGNNLIVLVDNGDIFQFTYNSEDDFAFKKISGGWAGGQIAPLNDKSFVVHSRYGKVRIKELEKSMVEIGSFAQGMDVDAYKLFKTSDGKIFIYNPALDGLPKPRLFSKAKKIISLGWKCLVRYNIQTTYYQAPSMMTNLFDWVYSRNMATISRLLRANAVGARELFDRNNIDVDTSEISDKTRVYKGNYMASLRSMPDFKAPHDVSVEAYGRDRTAALDDFVDKYQRRHQRMIQTITSEDGIYFLRWGEFDNLAEHDVQEFFAALEQLHPGNNHFLVFVNKNGDKENYRQMEQNYRFKFFNLREFPTKGSQATASWRQDHLAWEYVFDWIDRH